jgi:hypothetical protein
VFCPQGSTNINSLCTIGCSFCTNLSTSGCTSCFDGFTLSSSGGGCLTGCPPGQYNVTGKCVNCLPGSFCPGNGSAVVPCPIGTASNLTGLASCPWCAPGSYMQSTGALACIICPNQFVCPLNGTIQPQPCPAGYTCTIGCAIPQICPAGTFAPSYSDTCSSCLAGFSCPSPGLSAQYPCTAGYFCNTTLSSQAPCLAGYFSLALATSCSTCFAGTFLFRILYLHYHVYGFIFIFCESVISGTCSGSYNPSNISTSCIPCDSGRYCDKAGLSMALPCPAGSQCPLGTVLPVLCLPGTFSLISASLCSPCPAGFYCGLQNMSVPLACPLGFFCGYSGMSSPDFNNATFVALTNSYSNAAGWALRSEWASSWPGTVNLQLRVNCLSDVNILLFSNGNMTSNLSWTLAVSAIGKTTFTLYQRPIGCQATACSCTYRVWMDLLLYYFYYNVCIFCFQLC